MKIFLINCPEKNENVTVGFDVILTTTLSEPNKYVLGRMNHCSWNWDKTFCENCPIAKKLIGKPIT